MDEAPDMTLSMLTILLAMCESTRDILDEAGGPTCDEEFREALDRLILRTEVELAAFGFPLDVAGTE